MTTKEGIKIYENLGGGVEVIDAETYNQPMIDCARNIYHAFLYTAIFIGIFFLAWFLLVVLHPYAMTTTCNAYPNMNSVLCSGWIK